MPPDRVFGRIEQKLRKKENIVSPNQYYVIFKEEFYEDLLMQSTDQDNNE